MSSKNIIIVGSGTGGTLTANLLASRLKKLIKNGKLRIILLSENDRHYFQPANLDVAFRGADPAKFYKKVSELVRHGIQLLNKPARRIDLSNRLVRIDDGEILRYDYLVVSTGSIALPSAIPGLAEGSMNFHTGPEDASKIWNAIQKINRGKILIVISSVPYKCPPSPNECAFLLDEYFRKRGIRRQIEITFLTPFARAYPAHSISEIIDRLFEERNIEVVPFFNLESVDPKQRKVYSYEGEEFNYDALIAIPPHFGAELIRTSDIGDKDGWIPTNKWDMTIMPYDDAYAIGDATDIPISKSGVVAHLESNVVSHNISAEIEGTGEKFGYNGRINCPMEVGFDRAIFVTGSYSTPPKPNPPSLTKYMMKRLFGKFYWKVLSGKFEWMFDLYFGETKYRMKQRGTILHEEAGKISEAQK